LSQLEKNSVEASDREDSFLTVAEVAETLKLNQQTVRNWIDQGSLPALRVGRRVRIRRSDFDRLLDENYSGGGATSSGPPGAPNADDFWGGEPVGLPDARARESGETASRFGDEGGSAEHLNHEGGSAEHLNRDAPRSDEERHGFEGGSAEHPAHASEPDGG
jgi:excisionase family DNA binding protein